MRLTLILLITLMCAAQVNADGPDLGTTTKWLRTNMGELSLDSGSKSAHWFSDFDLNSGIATFRSGEFHHSSSNYNHNAYIRWLVPVNQIRVCFIYSPDRHKQSGFLLQCKIENDANSIKSILVSYYDADLKNLDSKSWVSMYFETEKAAERVQNALKRLIELQREADPF
jgi:hypothetical protein